MTQLILNNTEIQARDSDNFINATQLCKAGGKEFGHWMRLESTQTLINTLENSLNNSNIHINMNKNPRVIEVARGRYGGSWIHPKLAVHLASWLSPEFALQVSDWVLELLTTGTVSLPTPPPEVKELEEKERFRLEMDQARVELDERRAQLEILKENHKDELRKKKLKTLEMADDLARTMGITDPRFKIQLEDELRNTVSTPTVVDTKDGPQTIAGYFEHKYNRIVDMNISSTVGRRVAQLYRQRYSVPNEATTRKQVNGELRDVKVYHPKDFDLIEEAIGENRILLTLTDA